MYNIVSDNKFSLNLTFICFYYRDVAPIRICFIEACDVCVEIRLVKEAKTICKSAIFSLKKTFYNTGQRAYAKYIA